MSIILTGSIAVDRIMLFPGKFEEVIHPEKLHVLSISVLLKELKDSRGGIAANIAYTLALLGETPILYGSVGEDQRANMESLNHLGVDVSKVHYSKLPTATFTVMTDLNDCQVGGFYPGAMGDASSLSFTPFIKQKNLFVISAHDPGQMAKQVTECKEHHLRLFYDVGQQASNIPGEDIRSGIEVAELLIVNDYEMGILAQKTGLSETEITKKVRVVVVTLGEKGSRVIANGKEVAVPATKVKQVVDPTGAGDAFRGGFLYGYSHDLTPEICAQLGAVAAAYAVEHKGTQEHTYTMAEFKDRYTQQFGKFPL